MSGSRLPPGRLPRAEALLASIAVLAAAVIVGVTPAQRAAAAATGNPIPAENSQPGTTSWQIPYGRLASHREIEGYASANSVSAGQSLRFMVSVTVPQTFTIAFYRMGWYGGAGGRLLLTAGPLSGSYRGLPAPTAPPDSLVEARWPSSYTLKVPSGWVSGYYLAKLVRADGYSRYVPFIVRNDLDTAPIVVQASMTTWQAYNRWGGYSLYGQFNYDYTSPGFDQTLSGQMAAVVSFDRPYDDVDESDGAGEFFSWEYPMVRYLERAGRWVTYVADTDLETRPALLTSTGRRAFLSVGHDEYWSSAMRSAVEGARDAGVNLGFFSGNQVYWKIRFDSDYAGVAVRREVVYKNGTDPHPSLGVTGYWRIVGTPENALLDSLSAGVNWQGADDYAITDPGSYGWMYAYTGLAPGDRLAGLVGYEYDDVAANGYQPAGVQVLAQTGTSDGGRASSVVYRASSGALVMNVGSIQWTLGLDAYRSPWEAASALGIPGCPPGGGTPPCALWAQGQLLSNVLDRFTGVTTPPPSLPGPPSGVTAKPGPAGAVVSWTPPGSDGGSPIGGYRVTASGPAAPPPQVFASTATTETVTGLSNGSSYTFTVAAINTVGTGPASPPSAPVVPLALPGAPTAVSAVPGLGSATVSWTAPADSGGSALTGYRVTTYGPAAPAPLTIASTATSESVGGLAAGSAYSFSVAAISSAGTGPESAPSNEVVPWAELPGEPTSVTAVAMPGAASVRWTPPASDGGSPLTGYVVTASGPSAPGPLSVAAPATTATVEGLTNGSTYTFTVAAVNAIGTGPASGSSNAVIPAPPAAGSLVQAVTAAANLAATASVAYPSPVTAGDLLAVAVAFPAAWADRVVSVTDSAGASWTPAVVSAASVQDACGDDAEIWTATAAASGPLTVNVNLSRAAGQWVNWNLTLAEVTGNASAAGTGAAAGTATIHTAGIATVPAGAFALAMYVDCGNNSPVGIDPGWTEFGRNTSNAAYQPVSDQGYRLSLPAGSLLASFTTSQAVPAAVAVAAFTPAG